MRAVAVPYIIALVLGVAVIGLVGYWFATTGGKFGGQSTKTICENKFLQYCITKSGEVSYSVFQAEVTECKAVDSSYQKCSDITGGGIGVGGGGEGIEGVGGEKKGLDKDAKCKEGIPADQNENAPCTPDQGKECKVGLLCKYSQGYCRCV